MRSMFVRQTIAGVYPARHGSCSLFGSFDVYFIFESAFHPYYRESPPSTPAMLSLALSSSSSTSTPSSLTSDSATSNSSSHYDSFHANPPTPFTHTHEMSEVMIDMGVDGDHVGIVDGDSASGNAVYSSSGKSFISKFCVHISTSIQLIIFPSRHIANTRLFRLIFLNRYMAPSNDLPPSSQVTRSLWQTTQETPLPADTLPILGKASQTPPR